MKRRTRTHTAAPRPHFSAARPSALTFARGFVAMAAAALVVVVLPASFGLGAPAASAPKRQVLLTPTQDSQAPSATALRLQLRGTRLTDELRGLLAGKHPSERRLVVLSKAREKVLLQLLGENPPAVRSLVLERSARRKLARVRGAQVERAVALAGRSRVWHSDDFKHPSRDVYLDQLATANGKIFTLHGARSQVAVRLTFARLKPATSLAVHGYAFGSQLLATRAWTPGGRALASAATAATTGPVGVAVIVATFSDSQTPVDMNAIRSNFQGNPGHDVRSFFNEASYGKMSISPSFFGPYQLSQTTSSGCSSNPTQSLISAAAANVTFAQYSRLIFVYNCPWSNFGSATNVAAVATPQGTVQAAQIALDSGSAADLYSVVHELSHTLGSFLSHAASYICLPDSFTAPSRFDTGCTSAEYGDSFDTLGSPPTGSLAQLDPSHKASAGWFDAAQYPTVTASGTFTLGPYEQSAGAQPLALNIPRGQSGTAFTVEYRQPTGYDAWMGTPACPGCTVTQGASIRLVDGASGSGGGSDTQLIDTTPGTIASSNYYPTEDARDGALLAGRTFTDPEYGISIKTVSAGPSGLTVQVTVSPQTCVHRTPTVTMPSPASISGAVGQTTTTTVTLTNTDSASCPVNTFRYFQPSSAAVSVVASPDYLALAPGASAAITLKVKALPLTTAGVYGLTSSGSFQSNSLGTGDATVSGLSYQLTSVADSTAPSAPGGLKTQARGASVVDVSWSPASDNVGVVGYRIARAGGVFTTDTNALVDNSVASGVSYTYSVQAFDRRGNLSPATTVVAAVPARTDTSAPTAPTVTAVGGDHSINVSWTPSTDNVGVAYYRIFPCLVSQCLLPASAHSVTFDGLPTRTRFDLQVLGVDGDGNTSGIGYGKYTIYTAAAGTTAPSQPQRLSSPAGGYHHIELSWTPSSDDRGVAAYAVYRNNRQIATVTSESYTDTLVGCPSEYYVQAIDTDGSLSAPSARVWFPAPFSGSSDSSSPTTAVTAPGDGENVSGTLTVAADASDNVGVTRVELYVDNVLKGTRTAAPYSFSLDTTTLSDGAHWLYVRAYDAAGNYGASAGTSFSVNDNGDADTTPPSVTIVDPTSGTTVSGPVTVDATASDNVGVASVEIAVDNAVVAVDTTPPYDASWDASNAGPGSHTITATARDAAGNNATDSVHVMRPVPADTTPPTVAFTAPANGASVTGTVQVQASAADDVGVTKVEFSVDGSLASTVTSAPWTFALDASTLSAGSHSLTASAYDAAGNASSAQISVSVPNPAPTDTTVPSAPASVKAALVGTSQVVLTWAASKDNVGVVAYEIYRDSAKVGETPTLRYLDSGLVPNTSHTYQVVARDAAGNRSALSAKATAKTVALATSATGTLTGIVFNQQGKLLANVVAQVTVNGVVKSVKTNNTGVWKLTSVPPGVYTVTLTLAGYQGGTSDVSALAGQTVVLVSELSP